MDNLFFRMRNDFDRMIQANIPGQNHDCSTPRLRERIGRYSRLQRRNPLCAVRKERGNEAGAANVTQR